MKVTVQGRDEGDAAQGRSNLHCQGSLCWGRPSEGGALGSSYDSELRALFAKDRSFRRFPGVSKAFGSEHLEVTTILLK